MELLLIRHALPVRVEGVAGRADPGLSDVGHAQAARLAGYLAIERLDAVYTSPLARARQTARPVAEHQGVPTVVVDELAEFDRHTGEYVPVEELKAANDPRWLALKAGTYGWGGEHTPEQFQAHVVAAVEALVARHPGQKIAAVCHAGVIGTFLAHVLERADPQVFFYPNYTSIHRVAAARSGERSIMTVNETAHLRGTGLPMGLSS